MLNTRILLTKCFSALKSAAPSFSKYSGHVLRHINKRDIHESRKLTNILTRTSWSGFICGSAVCYFVNERYKSNRFIVNALSDIHQPHNFLADVIEEAQPAVVFIEVLIRHPNNRNVVVKSHGSGFIVREDGLILTNAHVVSRQATVNVKLHDGRIVEGQVQAVDAVTDLATVKINEKNLPTLKLGKSSVSRPGEFVIAMGSPLTLNNTVTHGIISSVRRGSDELGMHNRDMEYIQTDAVITKGNSGGPLVNLKGEAIGINTLNMMSGISFAIPSDKAVEFLNKADLLEKRVSNKGGSSFWNKTKKQGSYIGITMFTLSHDFLTDLQSRIPDFPQDITAGVIVQTVIAGSPAHRAGIVPGDVIVKINNKNVKSSEEVYRCVESSDILRIEIARRNKKLTLTVSPDIS